MHMAEIRTLEFAEGKTTNYVDGLSFSLSSKLKEQIKSYANECMRAYGGKEPEPTKMQRLYGVPSNLVRVDCTVENPQLNGVSNGNYTINGAKVNGYEVEENPRGRNIVGLINPQFAEEFNLYHKPSQNNIAIVSALRYTRQNYDDALIKGYCVEVQEIQNRIDCNPDIFINPIDTKDDRLGTNYPELQQHLGTTSVSEGSKEYQIDLGYAKRCSAELKRLRKDDMNQPLFFQPAANASKTYGVAFYHPDETFTNRVPQTDQRYLIDKKKAIKYLGDSKFIVKDYYPPIDISQIANEANLSALKGCVGIIRYYLAFCSFTKEFVPIGGTFVARPQGNIIIHGTQDAFSIPIN